MIQTLSSFDRATIHFEVRGNPKRMPTVIFVHGMGGDLTAWNQSCSFFAEKGYATVALDLRGHGFSLRAKNHEFYSLDNFARDVIAVQEACGAKKAVYVGHCFGGIVSLIAVARYHARVRGLVLVDSGYMHPEVHIPVGDPRLISFMAGLFAKLPIPLHRHSRPDYSRFVGSSDFDKRRILSDILHTSLSSYLHILSHAYAFNGEALLDTISCPTLIIEGENDTIFPPAVARTMHRRIKTSTLSLIPDTNHIIVLNNPKEMNGELYRFLRRIDLRGESS